ISAPSSESPSTSVTRLSFPAPAPMPAEMPQEPQKAEEPEKEVVKEVPEKPPELARKVIKKKKEVVKAKPEVKPMQQAASAHAESTPQINEGVIQRETERYLSSVMAHIEKHKWYPKAARRRGIEGEISVRFMLLPDGSAVGVVAENGPPLLVSAARQAVETAVPLPKPPATVHCPLECEFRMRFSLNAS
ncbi:MAG: TonB family protein, partial [Mariprofundaceae bacterium]|nr:TonB family protein [Mariprofundaceae bacterium]